MALPSTRLEYRIALSDTERGVDLEKSLVVAQHPSETRDHVTLRVLAYCLLYEERLEFGAGLSDGDAADLWARSLTGEVTAWVECGSADADKLRKVMLHNGQAAVHAVLCEARRRDELLAGIGEWKKAPRGRGELSIWMIDRELVTALARRDERRHSWAITLVEGRAYVEADGVSLEGEIERVRPLEIG